MKRPFVAPSPMGAGRRQRPDCHDEPASSARPGTAHSALGGECPPPHPPTGHSGRPSGAGGWAPDTGGEPQWIGADGSGRAAEPLPPPPPPPAPAPPVTAPAPTAAVGDIRLPICNAFSTISRAQTESQAPPPPAPPCPPPCRTGKGEGRATGDAQGGALPPPPRHFYPHLLLRLCRRLRR